MLALVIVLALTNLLTVGALLAVARRRLTPSDDGLAPDPVVSDALAATSRPAASNSPGGHPRRLISIEILNPVELASVRGRLFGIAGSLVPHLTRRIVYEQTVRQLREQLAVNHVVADVRVHVLPADRPGEQIVSHPLQIDVKVDETRALEPDPAYDPPFQ